MSFSKIILSALLLLVSSSSFGQVSLGYTNAEQISISHPLYEKALADLTAYQTSLMDQYNVHQSKLSDKVEEYKLMHENGEDAAVIKETEIEIASLEAKLKEIAQSFDSDLEKRKGELVEPILDDVTNSFEKVSNKLKLNAILQSANNSGVSFVLYAPEETDITEYLLRETGSGKARVFATEYKTDPPKVKIGYTNIELILAYMPEYKSMEQILATRRKKLSVKYNERSENLKSVYLEYEEKQAAGLLSENGRNFYADKINGLDTELQMLVEEINNELEELENEETEKILTKLQSAIDKVAETYGFSFILNQTTSSGVSTIVHGPENCDVTSALCDELGIDVLENQKMTPTPKAGLKVGFVNVESLMFELPEFQLAKEKIDAFDEKITTEQRNLSGIRSEGENQAAWKKAEEQINSFQSEHLQPILELIQKEIDAIAAKEGYDYIINQTGGNVLHIAKKSDLDSKMRKALGIK